MVLLKHQLFVKKQSKTSNNNNNNQNNMNDVDSREMMPAHDLPRVKKLGKIWKQQELFKPCWTKTALKRECPENRPYECPKDCPKKSSKIVSK